MSLSENHENVTFQKIMKMSLFRKIMKMSLFQKVVRNVRNVNKTRAGPKDAVQWCTRTRTTVPHY